MYDELIDYSEKTTEGKTERINETTYLIFLFDVDAQENTLPPRARFDQVMRGLRLITDGPAGDFLAKFGLRILAQNNRVDLFRRALPSIRCPGRTITVQPNVSGVSGPFLNMFPGLLLQGGGADGVRQPHGQDQEVVGGGGRLAAAATGQVGHLFST